MGEIAEKFFAEVLQQAQDQDLLSDEHFSVDGTLIEAWASQKSFQRKDQPAPPPEDPGKLADVHGHARHVKVMDSGWPRQFENGLRISTEAMSVATGRRPSRERPAEPRLIAPRFLHSPESNAKAL